MGSSSLDNIYQACDGSDNILGLRMETKRKNSAYTEALIDSLISPRPDKLTTNEARPRKISAPQGLNRKQTASPEDEELKEINEAPPTSPNLCVDQMQMMKPLSISADNVQELMDNTDTGLPSKWKLYGMNARYIGNVVLH